MTVSCPGHWAVARLADIAEVRLGRQRSPARALGDHMRPYMRAANVTWAGITVDDVKEMDFTPAEQAVYGLRSGDILLSEASGSASEVGKPAIWRNEVPHACFQNTLIRVRAADYLVRFLYLHLFKDALTGAFAKASRGVGIHHLGAEALSDWQLVLPPSGEQLRIADAVDSYLSRLDVAMVSLERVQRNLKRYRASVLQAAVEGRLVPTEAELAKKEGRTYEPASKLLERILVERRRQWIEREAEKRVAKIQDGIEARCRRDLIKVDPADPAEMLAHAREVVAKKYQEPSTPEMTHLHELPDGWTWATIDQLTLSVRNGYSVAPDQNAGVPILRISAVRPLTLDFQDVRYLPTPASQYDAYLVGENDLLFTRYNGNPALVGACARVRPSTPARVYPDKLIRARLVDARFASFVELACNAGSSRRHIETWTKTTAGQAGISGSDIKRIPVPVPPLAEQERIGTRLDHDWSVGVTAERTVVAGLARVARLRQAVLNWAFDGRLVDQDPADEPASVLLDRIKAERAAAAPAKQPPRRKKHRATA